MKINILLLYFLIFSLAAKANSLADQYLLKAWSGNARIIIPSLSGDQKPAIDGVFTESEWANSARLAGFMGKNTLLVSGKRGSVYLSRDTKYLYIAVRTSTPDNDPGGGLTTNCFKRDSAVYSDDSVEILITSDNKTNQIYQLIFNCRGAIFDQKITREPKKSDIKWNIAGLKLGSIAESGWWTLELAIPLKEIGNPSKFLKLNVGRNWTGTGAAALNATSAYANTKTMLRVDWNKKSPIIRQYDLGNTETGNWNIKFKVKNPADYPCKLAVLLRHYNYQKLKGRTTKIMKIDATKSVSIAPNGEASLELPVRIRDKYSHLLTSVLYNEKSGKLLYSRLLKARKGAVSGRQPATALFELSGLGTGICWYYPGFNRAAIQISLNQTSGIESVKITSSDTTGNSTSVNAILKKGYYRALIPIGKENGKYNLNVSVKLKGKTERLFKKVCVLQKRSFSWENNKLGKEKIILPPFLPIELKNNSIKVLLRQHKINTFGLWDSLLSKNKELLASPMYFEMLIGGKKQTWRGKIISSKIKNNGYAAKIITKAEASNGITICNEQTMEYDGFLWSKIKLENVKDKAIDNLKLVIPLKASEAKLFHAVANTTRTNPAGRLPAGSGEIWNGSLLMRSLSFGQEEIHPQVVPYIWLGGIERGICWFIDSSYGFKLDRSKSAVRIIRDKNKNTIYLEVDFINKKSLLKDGHSFEFGIQSTPVKPVKKYWRRLVFDATGTGIPGMQTNMMLSYLLIGYPFSWSKFPYKNNFNLFRQQTDIIRHGTHPNNDDLLKDWEKQYGTEVNKMFKSIKAPRESMTLKWFKQCRKNFQKLQINNPRRTHALPYKYSDPRLTYIPEEIPEYFKSEWWSPQPQNYFGAWRTYPVPSNMDYLVYSYYQELKNGMHGIYLDDVYLMPNPNTDTVAKVDENGEIHSQIGILALRELVKRIAVLQHKFNKYPRMLQVHMTNSLLVPCFSFATSQLGWETKFGETPFQERCTLESILTTNTGRQIGADSVALVGILRRTTPVAEWKSKQSQLTRTFLTMSLPHGIKARRRIMPEADWNVIRNIYGLIAKFKCWEQDCKFIPYWENDPAIRVNKPEFIVSGYVRPGETLLIVSNLKNAGNVKLMLNKQALGLPANAKAVDIESGKQIDFDKLFVQKYDFRLIKISK
jgi:hypothetical protein